MKCFHTLVAAGILTGNVPGCVEIRSAGVLSF